MASSGEGQAIAQLAMFSLCEGGSLGNGTSAQTGVRGPAAAEEGILILGNRRLVVYGRTLKVILWLIDRQQRINQIASAAGQLWLTWKGDGSHSITGDIKAPL